MKFTAAGDAIIQRRIQENFVGYDEITPFIKQGEARFFNLETTLHYEGECYASQFSGGTYIRTNPEVLDDLKKFGFNMTSFNNNHALDFSYNGFLKTFEYVKASGLVQSGTGRNLDEASAPKYLDTPSGRVALIALNTSFNPTAIAGEQGKRVPGRPGINGIRIEENMTVNAEELAFIRSLAQKTGINVADDISRKEGYLPKLPDDEAILGTLRFKVGEKTKYNLSANKQDMARVQKAIFEAQLQADYIMISIHSHQIDGKEKEDVPAFLQDIAHQCIDMGANAVVGHGPHLLRPIEVYKDCPIFYSLGDFILQLYNVEFAPEEFYKSYGLDSTHTVHELLKKRSADFTRGLMEDIRMLQTVVPYWETKDGKLTKLTLLPLQLSQKGHRSEIGLPRKATNLEFIDKLASISAYSGLKMKVEKDLTISCTW